MGEKSKLPIKKEVKVVVRITLLIKETDSQAIGQSKFARKYRETIDCWMICEASFLVFAPEDTDKGTHNHNIHINLGA